MQEGTALAGSQRVAEQADTRPSTLVSVSRSVLSPLPHGTQAVKARGGKAEDADADPAAISRDGDERCSSVV